MIQFSGGKPEQMLKYSDPANMCLCARAGNVASCFVRKKKKSYVLMENHVLCHGKSELKCWRQWDHSSRGHLWIKKKKEKKEEL